MTLTFSPLQILVCFRCPSRCSLSYFCLHDSLYEFHGNYQLHDLRFSGLRLCCLLFASRLFLDTRRADDNVNLDAALSTKLVYCILDWRCCGDIGSCHVHRIDPGNDSLLASVGGTLSRLNIGKQCLGCGFNINNVNSD